MPSAEKLLLGKSWIACVTICSLQAYTSTNMLKLYSSYCRSTPRDLTNGWHATSCLRKGSFCILPRCIGALTFRGTMSDDIVLCLTLYNCSSLCERAGQALGAGGGGGAAWRQGTRTGGGQAARPFNINKWRVCAAQTNKAAINRAAGCCAGQDRLSWGSPPANAVSQPPGSCLRGA